MASATFEDHPTDPDKMILRKPRLDQGADYERGFIDGMMYQTQTTVNKAVDAMSKRTWVGLTDEELSILGEKFTHPDEGIDEVDFGMEIQRILKEKNK